MRGREGLDLGWVSQSWEKGGNNVLNICRIINDLLEISSVAESVQHICLIVYGHGK